MVPTERWSAERGARRAACGVRLVVPVVDAVVAWAIQVGVECPLGKRLRRMLEGPRLAARLSFTG